MHNLDYDFDHEISVMIHISDGVKFSDPVNSQVFIMFSKLVQNSAFPHRILIP